MRFRLSLLILLISIHMQGQTIVPGGTVNQYYAVKQVACNTAELSSTSGLQSGDRFMIIQMKEGLADSSNSPNFGTNHNYEDNANLELGYIKSIKGNRVFFSKPLLGHYDVRYKVQLIKVAVYTSVRFTGNIYPTPWNGSTGGVLAIEVSGTMYLEANIDASGAGFKGGSAGPTSPLAACPACANVNIHASATNAVTGGQKGEGIFEIFNPLRSGTAPNINGGGAGTCKNGGGGGGSNAGAGGKGGNSSNECGTPVEISAGRGGVPLLYNSFPSRAYAGGGGGGGNQDNSPVEGSSGVAGGGIIYIYAASISSLSGQPQGSILANGLSAMGGEKDGAGGGGAGGTILLNIPDSRLLSVFAKGGKGGDITLSREDFCYAPGGGGGGGLIRLSPGSSSNLICNVSAGASGLIDGEFTDCHNSSFGADSGRTGLILNDLQMREASIALDPFSLGNDSVFCESADIILDVGPGRSQILWNDGSSNRTLKIQNSGIYSVEFFDEFGCYYNDSISFKHEAPGLFIGNDTIVCPGATMQLIADTGFVSYLWSGGQSSRNFLVKEAGIYWVQARRLSGCLLTDTIIVQNSTEAIKLGNDTVICIGKAILLDAGGFYPSYLWSSGLNGRYYIATENDTVWVRATASNGCIVSDTIVIVLKPGKEVHIGSDTMICTGTELNLDAGAGFLSYQWNSGENIRAIKIIQPGKYWVKVLDSNQCRSSDTIEVLLSNSSDTLYLPNSFTPNKDGFNEFFPGAELGEIKDFEIHIYNSFGEKVFYSDNVQRTWDGTYMGKSAQAGVYIYKLRWRRCSGRYKNVKGSFTLYR